MTDLPAVIDFHSHYYPPAYLDALRRYGRSAVRERHKKLEAMVPEKGFLAGDRVSLADTTLIGVARWAEFHEAADAGDYPRLSALRQRIDALPAVRFAEALENGDMPSGSGALRGHVALNEVIDRFGT